LAYRAARRGHGHAVAGSHRSTGRGTCVATNSGEDKAPACLEMAGEVKTVRVSSAAAGQGGHDTAMVALVVGVDVDGLANEDGHHGGHEDASREWRALGRRWPAGGWLLMSKFHHRYTNTFACI
jgi:hypothetical protein